MTNKFGFINNYIDSFKLIKDNFKNFKSLFYKFNLYFLLLVLCFIVFIVILSLVSSVLDYFTGISFMQYFILDSADNIVINNVQVLKERLLSISLRDVLMIIFGSAFIVPLFISYNDFILSNIRKKTKIKSDLNTDINISSENSEDDQQDNILKLVRSWAFIPTIKRIKITVVSFILIVFNKIFSVSSLFAAFFVVNNYLILADISGFLSLILFALWFLLSLFLALFFYGISSITYYYIVDNPGKELNSLVAALQYGFNNKLKVFLLGLNNTILASLCFIAIFLIIFIPYIITLSLIIAGINHYLIGFIVLTIGLPFCIMGTLWGSAYLLSVYYAYSGYFYNFFCGPDVNK